MIHEPINIFLISNNLFAIPAMQVFVEKNNGELVGTQSDLKTIPLDRSIKKTKAEILIISQDVTNTDCKLIEGIQMEHPNIRVIMILKETEDIPKLIIEDSVSGILLIDEGFDELIRAIKAVKEGQNYYSPKVTKVMAQELKTKYANLTPCETDILALSMLKINRAGMSKILEIRRSTVRSHIRNIKNKLGPNAITI